MSASGTVGSLTRHEAENQLITRAWKEPIFKELLLRDPKAAIALEFGVTIPDEVEVVVLQETSSTAYLVLPAAPADIPLEELGDEELEHIVGKARATARGCGDDGGTPDGGPGGGGCGCIQTRSRSYDPGR